MIASCRTRFAGFAELELPLDCQVKVGEAPPGDGPLSVPVSLVLSQPGQDRVTTAAMVVQAHRG